jgi:hypothetical protein
MRDTIDMAREAGFETMLREGKILGFDRDGDYTEELKAFEALVRADEQALASPVQEPVAWAMYQKGRLQSFWMDKGDAFDFEFTSEHSWAPLYTTPPAAQPAPVQEPVQVWQAEGYDALMQEMQMVKARNIRQHAEIERLSALVRAQQITIDKLEQALAAPVQEPDHGDELTIAHMSGLQRGKDFAAQRQWVGLTDEEFNELYDSYVPTACYALLIEMVEAKLKEKNA